MSGPAHQFPNDPDPKAAERIARERIDELAAQLGLAEVVELDEAVGALTAIEDCTPDLLSDEVLLSAAHRYLRFRKRWPAEEPDPEAILRGVQDELPE
jgi:hypothetical protein